MRVRTVLILRIRQAEVALAGGRLDDAYEQAIRPDVREHRRGQRLINRLVDGYVKRGQLHLSEGNARLAVSDCDRAARLGGNQPKIAQLKTAAEQLFAAEIAEQHRRQKQVAAARQCIAQGDFSIGERLCEQVANPGSTVAGLVEDVEIRRRRVDAAMERARCGVKQRNYEQAIVALADASALQPKNHEIEQLSADVTRMVLDQIRSKLDEGRLDQAESLLARLGKLSETNLEQEELARVLAQCRSAASALRSAFPADVSHNLKALRQVLPRAKWLDRSIKNAEVASSAMESLRSGPLGLLNGASPSLARPAASNLDATLPKHEPHAVALPSRFLIQVDGAGSFLVVRNQTITLGSASRSRPVDVPLLGQANVPHVSIQRIEDDYFISSDAPIQINDQPTTNKLLAGGDRIRIGRRGSLKFLQPCAASTSAVLEMSAGTRMLQGNARRVILMDDSILVAPNGTAHIHASHLARPFVLHVADGQLQARPMSRDGRPTMISLEQPVEIEGLTFVVTPGIETMGYA